ncbi:MAG: DUF2846 domain-containing protein [Pseudobdellovibrionaceae bacterium]
MRNFRVYLFTAFLILVSACATVPMESQRADEEAKKFQVPPDKSRIYVFREGYFAGGVKVPIALNGQIKGSTAGDTFFMWDVEPGRYEIECFGSKDGRLVVNTQKGKATFVEQDMTWGFWYAGCELEEDSEQDGKDDVGDSSMAQSR